MDLGQVERWTRLGRRPSWYGDLRQLGASLRAARRDTGRLLLTGHPDDPPWHLAAHLDLMAKFGGVPDLEPTLVTPDQLSDADRRDTLMVVSEHAVPEQVLERVHDVRTHGATVFGLSSEDEELESVAHEAVRIDLENTKTRSGLFVPDFEVASHLFGYVAGRSPRKRLWGRGS
jgi:hypothetical protein